jgi:DNA polymerase/3'-5' exonuclease PolX
VDDRLENRRIAASLREAGERLQERGANAFSAAAYCRAADVVEGWPQPLREIHERLGPAALEALPGVGRGIAGAIAEMLITGRWLRLERMRSERSILYTDEEGVEHESTVIEPRPRRRLSGRAAIAEMLRHDDGH